MKVASRAHFQWTTQHYIPEDSTLPNHCYENIKSYILKTFPRFSCTCTYPQEHGMLAVRTTIISEAATICMFLCYVAFPRNVTDTQIRISQSISRALSWKLSWHDWDKPCKTSVRMDNHKIKYRNFLNITELWEATSRFKSTYIYLMESKDKLLKLSDHVKKNSRIKI